MASIPIGLPTLIAQDRLELLQDGRVRYRFKRAWKDGSTAVDLEPFDLLA